MIQDQLILFPLSFLICFLVFNIYVSLKEYSKRQKVEAIKREQFRKEQEKIAIEKKNLKEQKIQQSLNERERKYGTLTKMIPILQGDPLKDIAVYGDSKIIFIKGNAYNFCDIIGCEMDTKVKTIKGKEKIIHTTPSDWDKSSYKAEHFLSGKELIEETTIERSPDVTHSNYSLYIYINDLANPSIRINCSQDDLKANEINSTIKVIINQNGQGDKKGKS